MKVSLRFVFCILASSIAIRVFRSSCSSNSRGDIPSPVRTLQGGGLFFAQVDDFLAGTRSRRRLFTISIFVTLHT